MVDIHTHIIPGVDDGARDEADVIAMARMAVEDGVTTLVATPHAFWVDHLNDDGVISSGVSKVREILEGAAIPLKVVPGCEVPLDPRVLSHLNTNRLWTINGANAYLLLEPPWNSLPVDTFEIVNRFVSSGITPVIAHPERCPDLQQEPEKIKKMVDAGCLTQVTANSLTGRHGKIAREIALKMLDAGQIHVVSSDAHNSENRAPVMQEARSLVTERVGASLAREVFQVNPQNIVDGFPVLYEIRQDDSEFDEPTRGNWFSSLLRRRKSY